MNEVKEISDLRPAPRTTPTSLLWTMLVVVIGGVGLLIWSPSGDKANAGASMVRAREPVQAASVPARASEVVVHASR